MFGIPVILCCSCYFTFLFLLFYDIPAPVIFWYSCCSCYFMIFLLFLLFHAEHSLAATQFYFLFSCSNTILLICLHDQILLKTSESWWVDKRKEIKLIKNKKLKKVNNLIRLLCALSIVYTQHIPWINLVFMDTRGDTWK